MKSASSSLIIILSLLTSYVLCAVDYTTEIQTIFDSKCTFCHSSSSHSSGLDLTSYANLMVGNSNHGPVVTSGNGSGSIIIQKLRDTANFGVQMPASGGFLDESDIQLIETWINEGANENSLSILSESNLYPDELSIIRNFPNPFNPVTRITYGLPVNTDVQIVVYDISGNRIQSLRNEFQTAGYYSINWNASSYPSGVYLIRMESGEFTQTQKVVLEK